MKTWMRVLVPTVLATAALAASAADYPSGLRGSWTMDAAKSKFDPGPTPSSMTWDDEQDRDSTQVTIRAQSPDGKTVQETATFKIDGKSYAVNGNPNIEKISTRRVSDRQMRTTLMRGGKVIGHMTSLLSADGKTRTNDMTLTTKAGQHEHDVVVLERK